MVKEGYVSEQALAARKAALDGVISNLKLVFDFYEENGILPRKNPNDRYETKLNNFFRRFDLDKYINDLDSKTVKKIIHIRKENEIRMKRIKSKKSLKTKQAYITKCIDEYYDFYVQNGRFPGENIKSERILSNAYNNIMRESKYFTSDNRSKINNINAIKSHNKNIKKLIHVKRYIDFCKKYERQPVFIENNEDITRAEKNERALAMYLSYKLDLDNIYIPYALLEELYSAIDYTKTKKVEKLTNYVNYLMDELLCLMKKYNLSCDNNFIRNMLIKVNGKTIKAENALTYVKEHISYVDDKKIKTYNEFKFIRKPLTKLSN